MCRRPILRRLRPRREVPPVRRRLEIRRQRMSPRAIPAPGPSSALPYRVPSVRDRAEALSAATCSGGKRTIPKYAGRDPTPAQSRDAKGGYDEENRLPHHPARRGNCQAITLAVTCQPPATEWLSFIYCSIDCDNPASFELTLGCVQSLSSSSELWSRTFTNI